MNLIFSLVGKIIQLSKHVERIPFMRMAQHNMWLKLAVSVITDGIGYFNLMIPILGQVMDLGWAPLSAAIVQYLYNNRFLTLLNFAKTVLPFTDLLPITTVAWALQYTQLGDSAHKYGYRRNEGMM